MLIAITTTPCAATDSLLRSVAQACDLSFMSESELDKKCEEALDGYKTGDKSGLYYLQYAHKYAMNSLLEDNILTSYSYAAMSNPMCLKVLLYCNPQEASYRSHGSYTVNGIMEEMDKRSINARSLSGKELYNIAEYDVFIDTTYVYPAEVSEILTRAIEEYKQGELKQQFWVCIQSMRPTELQGALSDRTEISLVLTDGDFYCISDHNGYYTQLRELQRICQVSIKPCTEEISKLSQNDMYDIEDDYDVSFGVSGLCKCSYRQDSYAIVMGYLKSIDKGGLGLEKRLDMLKESTGIYNIDRLADYLLKRRSL